MIELKFNISDLTETEKKVLQDKKDYTKKIKEEYLKKRGQVWSKEKCDTEVKKREREDRKKLEDVLEFNREVNNLKLDAMSNCNKIQNPHYNPHYKDNKNKNIEKEENNIEKENDIEKEENNDSSKLKKELVGKPLGKVSLDEVNEYFDNKGLKRKTISHRYFWWETYTVSEYISVRE